MLDERTGSPLEIQILRSDTVQDLREAVSRKKPPPARGAFWDFIFKRPEVQVQHTASTCLQNVLAHLLCNKRRSAGSSHEPLLAADRPPVGGVDLEGPPAKMETSVTLLEDSRTLASYGIDADGTLQVMASSDGERVRAREEARERARDEARQRSERQKIQKQNLADLRGCGCCCLIFALIQVVPPILFVRLNDSWRLSFDADCVGGREHYYDSDNLRGMNSASARDVVINYHATPFNEAKEFWTHVEQQASACGACLVSYTEAVAAVGDRMKREKGVGCCLPVFDVFRDQLELGRPFSTGEWERVSRRRRRRIQEQTIWKPNPVDPEHPYGVDFASTQKNYQKQLKNIKTRSCVDCLREKEPIAAHKWECLLRVGLKLKLPMPRPWDFDEEAVERESFTPSGSTGVKVSRRWKPRNRELEALKTGGNESRWCSIAERARLLDDEEVLDDAKTCRSLLADLAEGMFAVDLSLLFRDTQKG